MSAYIYIVSKAGHVIGATTRKYELAQWKSWDRPDDNLSMIPCTMVERVQNGNPNLDSVKFTLQEYLENPNKQFKA